MTSCSTWYPCLSKAPLTSSQVPGDEAEEEADDVPQVLLTAMLTLLQPRVAALTTPRHGAARVLVLSRPFQTLGSAPFFRQDLPSPHWLLACFSFKSLSVSLLVLTYLLALFFFLGPALRKSPKTNSPSAQDLLCLPDPAWYLHLSLNLQDLGAHCSPNKCQQL